MSRIVIAAKTDQKDVLTALHALLPEESLAGLRTSLLRGDPIVSDVFPGNDWEEVAARLRGVTSVLRAHGVEPTFYETDEVDTSGSLGEENEISREVFENTLRRYEEIHAETEALRERGHK